MKLRDGFILQDVGDEHLAVASGEAGRFFNGLIRNNASAHLVYQMLMKETTEAEIVDRLFETYDAPRDVIEADVHRLILKLQQANCLE